jgi:hypothetical protein
MQPTSHKTKSHIGFRVAMLSLAALLGGQCVWLLLPQLSAAGIERLPTDRASAARAAQNRGAAVRAASIGGVRGDLWATAAYTYADLLWEPRAADAGHVQALTAARASLDRALRAAPHAAAAWLLLAGLALRDPSPGAHAVEALKMSYYTGPSAQQLLPLRFRIAARSNFVGDVEMRQFISRDLRLLLAQKQKSTIIQGYLAASSAGRQFIEQTVNDIDPSALAWLHASAQPPELPN